MLHEISKWKANWIGHICVETTFCNGLLKERLKVRQKWLNLRRGEDTFI